MSADLFDAARSRLARTGLDSGSQTKISTFVRMAKSINVGLLSGYAWMPVAGPSQVHVHSQVFRETEAASLIARTTRWSADPKVLMEAAALAQPLWNEFAACPPVLWPGDSRAALRALALGHALLAQIRLTPCIPREMDAQDPYVLALQRLDADNGRMIQLQSRLLAAAAQEVPDAQVLVDRQQQAIRTAFAALLESLAR